MAPSCSSQTSAYCRSLVIMAISYIVSEIKRYIGRKSHSFIRRSRLGVSVRIVPHGLVLKKVECFLPDGEKVWEYVYSFQHYTVHERGGYPGGQTDTARRHRPRLCIASCGKISQRNANRR